MLRLFLLVVAVLVQAGAAKPSLTDAGRPRRLDPPSPEHLAQLQLPSQKLQTYGDLFRHLLGNSIAAAVGRLPANIAKQFENESTEGILVQSMSADLIRDAVLSEDERAILRNAVQRSIWDTIKDIFNLIMDAIKLWMDPTNFGDFNFHFNNSVVVGNLSLKALLVGHLRDIRLENYEIHPVQMCVRVHFVLPNVTLRTEYYDVDITLDLEDGGDTKFRLFGAGSGRIDLSNIKLHTDICVEDFSIEVRNMKISVEKDMVDLQNLFGGGAISDLISGVVTDVVPGLVDEFQPQLVNFVTRYINKLIKNILPWEKKHHTASSKTNKIVN